MFGHAKDGNLHFVLAEDVRSPAAVERYGEFTRGLVELVVGKYDGAHQGRARLGPQHGAVRGDEWGERAYGLMERDQARCWTPRGSSIPAWC